MAALERPLDRIAYALAHGLVLLALARTGPRTPPRAWQLAEAPGGRPLALAPPGSPPPCISLSHTPGLVACAVAPRPVGVDLEALDRPLDLAAVAGQALSPREREAWIAPPHLGSRRGFLERWTLKEAIAKAAGRGLHLPLPQLEVAVPQDQPPRVLALPAELGSSACWRLWRLEPGAAHVGGVAMAAAGTAADPELRCHWSDAGEIAAAIGAN